MTTWTPTTGGDAAVNGTNFQTALNSCALGDTIILQAGSTYSGNFVLPAKGAGTDYITIQSTSVASLPAGTRVTNASGGYMAKLMASSSIPALEAEADSHHYKLIGIEITNVGGSTVTQELIELGTRSSGGNIPFANHPHHITFDRCWMHEATNDTSTPDSITTTAIRAMFLNATDVTVTECRLAGFRAYQPTPAGVEASHCILFPTSALRVTVSNCYLEAWFCPLFFGGSGGESPNTATLTSPTYSGGTGSATFSSISNLAVGDLVAFKVTGGICPPTNYAHPSEAVQFQVAKVTNIAGSVVSYQSWGSYEGDVAGGNPLLQAPDAAGPAQWNGYLNEDITISRNQIVLNFNSTETVWTNTGGDPTTLPRSTQSNTGNAPKGVIELKMAKNVTIDGNTFEGWMNGIVITSRNQGNVFTSGGFPWAGIFNATITNNWWKRTTNWDRIYGVPIGGPFLEDNEFTSVRSGPITFSNNLIESGVEMIFANLAGGTLVTCTHNTYPGQDTTPGRSMIFCAGSHVDSLVFKDNILPNNENGFNDQSGLVGGAILSNTQTHNVIIDNRSAGTIIGDGPLDPRYPNDFIVSSHSAIGWIDETNGNFELSSSSTYKGAASDSTDPGVNMTTLRAALGITETVSPVIYPSPKHAHPTHGPRGGKMRLT